MASEDCGEGIVCFNEIEGKGGVDKVRVEKWREFLMPRALIGISYCFNYTNSTNSREGLDS